MHFFLELIMMEFQKRCWSYIFMCGEWQYNYIEWSVIFLAIDHVEKRNLHHLFFHHPYHNMKTGTWMPAERLYQHQVIVEPTSQTVVHHWETLGECLELVWILLLYELLRLNQDELSTWADVKLKRWHSASLMLGQRRRRWPNINLALFHCLDRYPLQGIIQGMVCRGLPAGGVVVVWGQRSAGQPGCDRGWYSSHPC